MIILDMTKKSTKVTLTEKAFSLENGVLTLSITLGTYDLTDKTITAVFDATGIETAPLDVVADVIQLPIVQGLVLAGYNNIQLNIREGLTLEQSPIMVWPVMPSLVGTDPAPTDVDIITALLAEAAATVARAEAAESITGDDKLATAADRIATGADRIAVNNALTNFDDVTLPAAVKTVDDETAAQILLVEGAGDAQILRVAGEGDTQVGRVTSEGGTQTGLVQAAGAAQVGLVEGEGNDQVAIVQQAGQNLQDLIDNAKIGVLSDLHTADKTTLVGSINEVYDSRISAPKRYGIRWNKINAVCTRLYDAAAITTVTANFGHFGAVNASYSNPFDALYPWRDRKLVNVNITTYRALIAAAGNVFDSIVAWEGDPDFKLDGTNGFVGVYTPEYWFKITETSTYIDCIISDMPIAGYTKFKATIGGRWFGVADGSGITSKPGMPVVSETMAAMHARATAVDMTLDDIWSYCATTLLCVVEYATLNSQLAIGKGVDGVYIQSVRPYIEETGVNRVVMTNAQAANFFTGVIIDIGTTEGAANVAHRTVTTVEEYVPDAAYHIVNFDGAPINTLAAQYVSAHGVTNLVTPEILSTSGYIGTNGKANAFYRGQVHHANLWRYVLGAYRETLTSKIWTAVDPTGAAAVNALNTAVHTDTGFVLPTGAGGAALSGYLGGLFTSEIPLAPFGSSVGGSDVNPVGDYLYVPTLATDNTVLLVGGDANRGADSGRFSGYWLNSAASSRWYIGALPFLKTPS